MTAAEERAFADVEAWAKTKLGLHFDAEQRPAMRRRLEGLAHRWGLGSWVEVLRRLEADDVDLSAAVAETVATHHTGFFREPMVLGRIERDVLPSLPRTRERRRVWSAASSTGEEAYSVAILLAELLGPLEAEQGFAILGTDLVHKVVRGAERGEYGPAAMKAVSPARRARWFEPLGSGRFRVRPEIRALCTFRRLNLVHEPWPFRQKFSIILCRNVLYYFDKPTRARVLDRMYECCEPGGWLLTSVSESLHELGSRWETVSSGVHRRR